MPGRRHANCKSSLEGGWEQVDHLAHNFGYRAFDDMVYLVQKYVPWGEDSPEWQEISQRGDSRGMDKPPNVTSLQQEIVGGEFQ